VRGYDNSVTDGASVTEAAGLLVPINVSRLQFFPETINEWVHFCVTVWSRS
jgi:hypothetical protein